jgi:DNA-directed RNA polymerase subunit K/omega
MPPKKDATSKSKKEPKKELKKDTKKVGKNVKFTNDENINTTKNAPTKENYPSRLGLNLDEDEIEKETELETEVEVETEKDIEEITEEHEEEDNIDEDHEVGDEIEYDEEEIDNIDDLYEDEDEDGIKIKKNKKKNKKKKDDDDDELKLEDEECEYDYSEIYDEKKEEPYTVVENSQRISLSKLTIYEKVNLIATRAKQISLGAKVNIKNTTGLNPIKIAELELENKVIPMKIKRILPDNKVEIWKLSELEID